MKLHGWSPEAYLSELIGTFFLVFTVSLNALQRTALAPISIGCIYMVMVSATATVSGAHFNPAVTLGALLGSRMLVSPRNACVYLVVQLLGGLLAGLVCWHVLGTTYTLHPAPGHSTFDVFVVEALFTAALVFVVRSLWPLQRKGAGQLYLPLSVGFTVMAAAFAIGGISGYSLNPAVAFGVIMSHWIRTGGGMGYFLVYFLSPLGGAVLGAGLANALGTAEYRWEVSEQVRLLPPRSRSAQFFTPS
uniref:Aquaporin n=1 Tax=Pyrodinium bahamense TaxID=73915 RepID=A0A7S0FY36_9DINO|mmetsp:Transcript_9314/g.26176  ORF Transcript_9314/g.26176 Transcript_9314/m.26176 type:complete len:247 (+) Transcript_9314:110-850(+)|eukprot:CAMPEP_0179075214 /NCGR_PEP_ID=MMETSP0796-20121207/33480_1 /TAXON_ID=73915 /ORGANISM="Pyrodinium bahamense, Strain pbaha01" /LENGTH=246 /DNA_ID=CAMNT_0020772449 /DNA_START=63 /DNA_END=803 /DNA_ORIENTATION=-